MSGLLCTENRDTSQLATVTQNDKYRLKEEEGGRRKNKSSIINLLKGKKKEENHLS